MNKQTNQKPPYTLKRIAIISKCAIYCFIFLNRRRRLYSDLSYMNALFPINFLCLIGEYRQVTLFGSLKRL